VGRLGKSMTTPSLLILTLGETTMAKEEAVGKDGYHTGREDREVDANTIGGMST
jgi:hypothetical protein